MRLLIYTGFLCFMFININGQNTAWKSKLGFSEEDKLLILHGDDLGVNHAVNIASMHGLQKGVLNSTSIMVPCPWFEEITAFFIENPQYDYGLHLTLTAEWKNYKWDGLIGKQNAPGLHNNSGYLFDNVSSVVENASNEEVESEIRAQIQKSLDAGLKPSHLDSHMGTIFAKKEFLESYIKLGEEFKIPVFLPLPPEHPFAYELLTPNSVLVNQLYMNDTHLEKEDIFDYYDNIIKNLKPGLNEIIVHLGKDNEELQATCIDHPYFGSSWRQFDWEYVTSTHLKELLEKENIKLITWRQIQEAIYGE